jgi:hypothetical protein
VISADTFLEKCVGDENMSENEENCRVLFEDFTTERPTVDDGIHMMLVLP